MPLRLRRNDQVIVLKGRAVGKKGKILRFETEGQQAYVQGVNLVKRFVRKTRKNPQGGVLEQEAPVRTCNLALFCNSCGKGRRFTVNVLKDGSKSRLCVKCQNVLSQV